MAQCDPPSSLGGPLRRRREKRQLERFALDAARRKPDSSSAHRHISIIEDLTAPEGRGPDGQAADAPSEPIGDKLPSGFHVRPVPIDQPIDEVP